MSAPENPPAFPSVCLGDPDHPASIPGMTLRDWFAGQALSGMLASVADDKAFRLAFTHAAPAAYRIADAMLAARSKGEEA